MFQQIGSDVTLSVLGRPVVEGGGGGGGGWGEEGGVVGEGVRKNTEN